MSGELLKATWLGVRDSTDPYRDPIDLEEMQEQVLIDKIGLYLWGRLAEIEAEGK